MRNTAHNGTRDPGSGTRGSRNYIHIAAGCLLNKKGEVLICQRPAHKLYAGEWEFPGGKVEPGETAEAALKRELHEELGITVTSCRPLIRLRHVYPELSVDLDTWLVTRFAGDATSTEHPAVAWVAPDQLPNWRLLAADRPIVAALRLPPHYIFTPPQADVAWLLRHLDLLPRPALLRLRLPHLPDADYEQAARQLLPHCRQYGLALVLDREPAMVQRIGAAGWHAAAEKIRALKERPVPADNWFGASAHDVAELEGARGAGADFAVVGAVLPNATHPDERTLGWPAFAALAGNAGLPVYAIGGMAPSLLGQAWTHGAQGVCGISAYWRFSFASGSAGSAPSSAGIT